jgi:hypothetical protein
MYSTSGLLMTDGNVNVSIPAMFVGSQYYLVVQHRNSISVWSKDPITISGTGPITYDFTSAPGAMKIMKTLGRNHKALKNN